MAALIFGLLAVPLVGLLTQERVTTQRSHLYYMALTAAREEMFTARFLAKAGAKPEQIQHGWTPLKGSVFERLKPVTVGTVPDESYRKEQERIQTQFTFLPGTGPIRLGVLSVRYENKEGGAGANEKGNAIDLPFGVHFPEANPCK